MSQVYKPLIPRTLIDVDKLDKAIKDFIPMKRVDFKAMHQTTYHDPLGIGYASPVTTRTITPEFMEAYIERHPLTAVLKAKGEYVPFIVGELLVVMVDPAGE
jgi:hypothetical protein